jgi:hypothetical protein
MEVLAQWDCHCLAPRWACPECDGEGIFERWLPRQDLSSMRGAYTIVSTERIKKAA